jgi:tRNA G46 methylase TrmB
MYKLIKDSIATKIVSIKRISDNAFIPFATDNTDYAEFKKLVAEGAELQDADGNVMSADAAQEFIRGLP